MDNRPYLSTYRDRHGKARWRFRRKGVTVSLPGQPGEEAFEAAYSTALNGGRPPAAAVVALPGRALPRSLRAAWRLHVRTPEFIGLRASSQRQYIDRAERFLEMPVTAGGSRQWGDVPVAELRRRHVKGILAGMADRPHAGTDVLGVLRKMIVAALDEEWILHDPTHRLRYRPRIDGHRAWSDDERARFEACYPLGTMPRTVYACALFSGQRRGDLVAYRWAQFDGNRLPLVQQKTGKALVLPVLPEWQQALDAAPRHGEWVLATEDGRQRSPEGLTNDFKRWTERAGLEGCTLHGLRKTLGKLLAEQRATTRELMDALGHDSIAQAENYSREAEQERLAQQAFAKVRKRLSPRLVVIKDRPE